MHENVFTDLQHMFSVAGWTFVQVVSFYFFIPMIIVILLLGFVFKVRDKMFSFLTTIAAAIFLYIFVNYGLPSITDVYYSKLGLK